MRLYEFKSFINFFSFIWLCSFPRF